MAQPAIQKAILNILDKKRYVLLCDLPDLIFQNFVYVKPETDIMITAGELAVVGEGYSEKFKKLFPYLTKDVQYVDQLKKKIEKGQYTGQRTMLIKSLMDDYLASCDIRSVKDAKTLVDNNPSLVSLKYHSIVDQVSGIYDMIIKHGPFYQAWKAKGKNYDKKMVKYFDELPTDHKKAA